MNDDIGHVSGTISAPGSTCAQLNSAFDLEGITGITFVDEVNPSPCRLATYGMYSVNSAKF